MSEPRKVVVWSILRLVAAAVIASGVIAQAVRSISSAAAADVGTVTANFFSFFTILSNVSSLVTIAVAGVLGLVAKGSWTEPRGLGVVLACVSTYMIVTGVVYNTLLRGIPLPQGVTVLWANEVLHVVGPVLLLADVLFAPGRRRLPWTTIWAVVSFPIVWVVYTMVRGPLVTNPTTGDPWWYPYPFLDPHQVGGYGGIVPYVIGIAIAIAGIGALVVLAGRRRDAPSASADLAATGTEYHEPGPDQERAVET